MQDWTEWTDKDNDDSRTLRCELEVVTFFSGPIWGEWRRPGDILVVDILELSALQGDVGFYRILLKNGGVF